MTRHPEDESTVGADSGSDDDTSTTLPDGNGSAPAVPGDAGTEVSAETNDENHDDIEAEHGEVTKSLAGTTWIALIVGALILILLLVFILQNLDSVRLNFFAWELNFPIGVGMLIAAIGGALLMACVGGVRMIQLRRQINHPNRR